MYVRIDVLRSIESFCSFYFVMIFFSPNVSLIHNVMLARTSLLLYFCCQGSGGWRWVQWNSNHFTSYHNHMHYYYFIDTIAFLFCFLGQLYYSCLTELYWSSIVYSPIQSWFFFGVVIQSTIIKHLN